MNLTEAKAKTKFCPYSHDNMLHWSKCIAEDCQAWTRGPDVIEEIETVTIATGDKPPGVIGVVAEYGKEFWTVGSTVSSGFMKYVKSVRHRGGFCGRVTHR